MKKNKVNIRDQRDKNAAAEKERYRQQQETQRKIAEKKAQEEASEKARLEEQRLLKTAEEKARERLKNEPDEGKTPKSAAKAAGLKSAFVMGPDSLLMTSFGKGNQAVTEKEVSCGKVQDLHDPAAYSAKQDGKKYRIDGRVLGAVLDDPLVHVLATDGKDMIHCRAALEERYFGKTFDDNIHIQLIYNALDIEKILAYHINNISYAMLNMLRREGLNFDDFIGYMGLEKSYEQFMNPNPKSDYYKTELEVKDIFTELCRQPQLRYFGITVNDRGSNVTGNAKLTNKKAKKDGPGDGLILSKEEFYYVICVIANLRQAMAHGADDALGIFYDLENKKSNAALGAKKILNRLYTDRIEELNRSFIDHSKKDLVILFKAFGVTETKQKACYVRDYYDFTVRKQYKNQGFSVKTLREIITDNIEEAHIIRDKKYDTVRQKVNRFFDFAVYRYYTDHPDRAEKLVTALRGSMNEVEKTQHYILEAEELWKNLRGLILEHVLPYMSGDVIKGITADPDVNADMIAEITLGTDASYFCKQMYLLTLFLDGKEINDLLTTMISKFENIAAFTSVLKDQQLYDRFEKMYSLFADSEKIAQDLRAVNSFARMTVTDPAAKPIMFVEAAKVLGYSESEEKLEAYISAVLEPDMGPRKWNARKQKEEKDNGFRNFIANNVVESTRFKYLMRYGNTNTISILARSRNIVSFVLKGIKDDMIVRYYNSCNLTNIPYNDTMREDLCDRITKLSFRDFEQVKQSAKIGDGTPAGEAKQRAAAVIRLYLLVLYELTKNLVYINSRYFLAFHCVERDSRLYGMPYKKGDDYELFACRFLLDHPGKKRVNEYLKQNFDNSDPWAIRAFRNTVDHMNAVNNAYAYIGDIGKFDTYFELYHYLVQRCLQAQLKFDQKRDKELQVKATTLHYFDCLDRYHTYNKDFVKALNVPFAYNLARYKNLSIEGLFDKNHPGDKGNVKPDECEEEKAGC